MFVEQKKLKESLKLSIYAKIVFYFRKEECCYA